MQCRDHQAGTLSRTVFSFASVLLAILLSSGSAISQNFKYPKDDLIVLVRAGGLLGLVDELQGTSYEALYHNNGSVCTTPHVTASLPFFEVPRHTRYDLRQGTTTTTIALGTQVNLAAAQCVGTTLNVSAGCLSQDVPLVGPPDRPIFFFARCDLDVFGFFHVALPVPVTIPSLVSVPKDFNVTLPGPLSFGDLALSLSFGKHNGSDWVKLNPPMDKKKEWPLTADVGLTDYITAGDPGTGIIDERKGRILVVKASATHQRFFEYTSDAKDAYSGMKGLNDVFYNPYAIAGVRIFDTLVAPPTVSSPTDQRYGLIGGLFPLIAEGVLKLPGGTLIFKVVFGSFTFSISGSPAMPHASLSIDSFSVEDSNGTPLTASLATRPTASVDMPIVAANGDISLRLSAVDTTLVVRLLDGSSVNLTLGPVLQSIINTALPTVSNVAPSVELGLPDCIDMQDNRYEALGTCANGNKTSYVSKSTGPGPVILSVDFTKTSVSMRTGEFRLDFEEKCVPTDNPRTQC